MRSFFGLVGLGLVFAACPSTSPQIVPPPEPETPETPDPEPAHETELTELAEGTRIRIDAVDAPDDDSVAVGAECVVVELWREDTDEPWEGTVRCPPASEDEVDIYTYNLLAFTILK